MTTSLYYLIAAAVVYITGGIYTYKTQKRECDRNHIQIQGSGYSDTTSYKLTIKNNGDSSFTVRDSSNYR